MLDQKVVGTRWAERQSKPLHKTKALVSLTLTDHAGSESSWQKTSRKTKQAPTQDQNSKALVVSATLTDHATLVDHSWKESRVHYHDRHQHSHTHIGISIHTHTSASAFTHTHRHQHSYTHIGISIHTHTHRHQHSHTHIGISIHTHTLASAFTHTRLWKEQGCKQAVIPKPETFSA